MRASRGEYLLPGTREVARGGIARMVPAMDKPPPGGSLPRLVEIMDRLLAPDGCPWDREQTLEALAHDDARAHCEELGDLLMQIVFHAALRQRQGAFAIDDVIAAISDKLV